MSIDADPSEGLLSSSDVAALLNVSVATVRRLQAQRKLPFVKVGGSVRFARNDIAAYVAAQRVRAIDQ